MLTKEKIAELKAAHGQDLSLHNLGDIQIVTRPVDLKAYRAFRRRSMSPREKGQAQDGLIFDVAVFPSPDTIRAYFDRKPFALPQFANEICKEAGVLWQWISQGVDGQGQETFRCEDMEVVLQPVSGVVGRLYQQREDDPQLGPGAVEWLLQQVIVSPEWPDVESRIHGRPFALDRLADIVTERAGRAVEVRTKKL
jgi:hypothetical protein